MEINDSRKNDIAVLELVGKLDAVSCGHLLERLFELIEAGDRKFLFDCYRLEYISSAGLRVFYQASNKLEPLGGRIVFCALHPNIKKVFDVVDMATDFPVFPSREEATRTLS